MKRTTLLYLLLLTLFSLPILGLLHLGSKLPAPPGGVEAASTKAPTTVESISPVQAMAAGILQKAGLISSTRGHVTIRDHAGLADAACECYKVVRDEYVRLGLLEEGPIEFPSARVIKLAVAGDN